jgi:hypothetical protein
MDFNKTLKKLNENEATEAISSFKDWCEIQKPKRFVDQYAAFKEWVAVVGMKSFPMQIIKMIQDNFNFREK